MRFATVVALLLLAAALIALAVDPATFDQRKGQYEAAVIGSWAGPVEPCATIALRGLALRGSEATGA